MRQAFAGLLWSKQLYCYNVARWLDGDPAQPAPPAQRLTGRNSRWRTFNASDIMSMPDKWEYPWFAAWDLAFHCIALAHVDPALAKYQLILLCREWFQNPDGALPAYEWDFGDVNPPVQAWAALEVFAILLSGAPGAQRLLLSLAGPARLERLLAWLFDEGEFLSPHGLRALSAWHRDNPAEFAVEGISASVDYEPAESTTAMFGGNSNWRGPVWFPLNYLMLSTLQRYYQFFGDEVTVEYPARSGQQLTLDQVRRDLSDRLISIFTRGPDGRRPCFGGTELLQNDPAWRDNLVFSEYFHGDNGAAIGAAHQTGWTGLIADVIRRRHGEVRSVSDVIQLMGKEGE